MSDKNTIAVYAHLLLKRQRDVKAAQSQLKSMVQQARSAGVRWVDVQAALKEYEMSTEARHERAERQANVLTALGVPVQIEMFDAYVPRDNDETAEARRRGWYAAIQDAPNNPPYEAGSPEGQAWLDGWHEFRTVLTDLLFADSAADNDGILPPEDAPAA